MKTGLGRVIVWLFMSVVLLVGFLAVTVLKQTQLVLIVGAALVMSISAAYITYKNYKGNKDKDKEQ